MSDSRNNILKRIQSGLGRETPNAVTLSGYEAMTLSRVKDVDLMNVFIQQAQQEKTQVLQTNQGQIVQTIADWLAQYRPNAVVTVAPALSTWDWQPLSIQVGLADEQTAVSITPCVCGVAETGTVVFASGSETPTTLNFLPEVHIVLLPKQAIVASYERAWQHVEALSYKPRTVNFISGPSRTGDIEQKIQFGAHGPREFVVVLYDDV